MIQMVKFMLSEFLAAQGGANQVHDQAHGQHTIKHKRDDGPKNAALGTKGFGQSHQQSDIKPCNDDQVHFFELRNLGDINLTDTAIS